MTVPTKSRFHRYAIVITRWFFVTTSVFAVTFLAGNYITTNLLTKYYTATARIEIRNTVPDHGSIAPAELETILSADVLLPVIKNLNLDTEWNRRIFNSQESTLTDLEAVGQMDKMLRLANPRGTDFVDITVVDDVPKEAAAIANAVADRYKTLRDSEVEQETSVHGQPAVLVADDQRPSLAVGASLPASEASPGIVTDVAPETETSPAVLRKGPVRIVSRAEVPTTPVRPNKNFCFYVTLTVSGLFSLMAASFVEVIFLFLRASEAAAPLPETKSRSVAA